MSTSSWCAIPSTVRKAEVFSYATRLNIRLGFASNFDTMGLSQITVAFFRHTSILIGPEVASHIRGYPCFSIAS
jgi:hypothetical protein